MGQGHPSEEDDAADEAFALDSDFAPRVDGQPGPPDDWKLARWRDFKRGEFWYRWRDGERHRLDPPPILMLGYKGGEYTIVTAARELRPFTSNQLHGRGGLADVFAGDVRWATRHFPGHDRHGDPTGRPDVQKLMEAIIAGCVSAGYYDGSQPFRSIGVWRGPDGSPVVHAGAKIFYQGKLWQPGEQIGTARYVVGPDRAAPAHITHADGGYEWLPADWPVRHQVMAHLDEWHWESPEARELMAGGLWCDMLGDALRWKVHKFLRALSGSGKSTLLKYIAALLGPAAHPIQRDFTKARLEERFKHTAAAILLEEAETDAGEDERKMAQIFKLVLLLSDEGATGGRFTRDIDLHGPVTMAATLTDDWKKTIRNRVVTLELRSLKQRTGHSMLSLDAIEAMIRTAADMSAGLRAAALELFDTFNKNLALARDRVMELGGDSRDGDTLGHLIAGWATLVLGRAMTADEIGNLDRFTPWIVTLQEQEDGDDDATELLNVLLGLPAQNWRGGDQLTIGQLVARAREPDNGDFRKALLPYGLRLEKLPTEGWHEAWLAVANKHPGLDRLLSDYPKYQGGRRKQILAELRIGADQAAKKSARPLKFAGPQARALLLDPRLLPTRKDDDDPASTKDDVVPMVER